MSTTLARPKYHQSHLQTFLKCGKQYEFRYIKGLVIPPRAALTVGKTVDRAVNANMISKIVGKPATLEEVLAVTSDEFDKEITSTVLEEDEQPGELKDQAIQLSQLHFKHVAPTIEPVTVQEEFVIEMEGGYDVGGTMDLTDKDGLIRDTKTAARQNASGYTVSRAFQPAMYDFAYEAIRGERAKGFVFDVLKKPTKRIAAEYERHDGKVEEDDRNWLFDSIDAVHKAIQAGVALPAPEGSWYCSPKWCGYWNICKGKRN